MKLSELQQTITQLNTQRAQLKETRVLMNTEKTDEECLLQAKIGIYRHIYNSYRDIINATEDKLLTEINETDELDKLYYLNIQLNCLEDFK